MNTCMRMCIHVVVIVSMERCILLITSVNVWQCFLLHLFVCLPLCKTLVVKPGE